MAIVRLVNTVKHAMLTPLKTAIDAGGAAGTIKIYTGAQPALPTDAATGTLLGTLTFSHPCNATVGTPTPGALTMEAILQDASADATGVAGWARIADSSGNTVCDVDITTAGGSGVIQMNTTNIVVGGPILVSSFYFAI